VASKTNANRQKLQAIDRHWTYKLEPYDPNVSNSNKEKEYSIFNAEGVLVTTVEKEKEAILITNAVNEYIDTQRTFGVPNSGIPRQGTLVRAIMDSVRKSRQRFDDRALEGVSIYGNYDSCIVHAVGECPPFDPYDIGMKKISCEYLAHSFIISLPNNIQYICKLEPVKNEDG